MGLLYCKLCILRHLTKWTIKFSNLAISSGDYAPFLEAPSPPPHTTTHVLVSRVHWCVTSAACFLGWAVITGLFLHQTSSPSPPPFPCRPPRPPRAARVRLKAALWVENASGNGGGAARLVAFRASRSIRVAVGRSRRGGGGGGAGGGHFSAGHDAVAATCHRRHCAVIDSCRRARDTWMTGGVTHRWPSICRSRDSDLDKPQWSSHWFSNVDWLFWTPITICHPLVWSGWGRFIIALDCTGAAIYWLVKLSCSNNWLPWSAWVLTDFECSYEGTGFFWVLCD